MAHVYMYFNLPQSWEYLFSFYGHSESKHVYFIIESSVRSHTRSGNILSFLLPLFQEGQLSVTGESMFTKYWLTAYRV